MKTRLRAALVIATLNREEALRNTIHHVSKLEPSPDEVWIVDQTLRHEDATEALLRQSVSHCFHVIRLREPGVCFARNLAAALTSCDIIIYIDDDVIIDDVRFIHHHLVQYNALSVAAVQGQIFEVGAARVHPVSTSAVGIPGSGVINFITANVSIRRATLLAVGGFDEGFSGRTYANEDGDLGLRLCKAGFTIVISEAARLTHVREGHGGNRIIGRDGFPEWTRSVTFFQFALRHNRGARRLWKVLQVFRTIALRRENVVNLWRVPWALVHAVYALIQALKRHRVGFRSSLVETGVAELRRHYAL